MQGQSALQPPGTSADPSFNKFIHQLKNDIALQEWNSLGEKLDRNIVNGFELESGTEAFFKKWNQVPSFWHVLEKLIDSGGRRISGYKYVFPYFYEDWPFNLEKSGHGIIHGRSVNIREEPTVMSKKVTQLSYELVRVSLDRSSAELGPNNSLKNNPADSYNWYYIETLNGDQCGYVYWEYLMMAAKYRMIVEKFNGNWIITAFIAEE